MALFEIGGVVPVAHPVKARAGRTSSGTALLPKKAIAREASMMRVPLSSATFSVPDKRLAARIAARNLYPFAGGWRFRAGLPWH
ncbi:MAG: hypothetical protein Q4P23_15395 [Micrococcaceae bacterium]|nr:hypothetical protein [Micrococcaceae bacterium]